MITLEELLNKKTQQEQEVEQLRTDLEKFIDSALLNKRRQGEVSFLTDVHFQVHNVKVDVSFYETEVIKPVKLKYTENGWDVWVRVKRYQIDPLLCSVEGTIKRNS